MKFFQNFYLKQTTFEKHGGVGKNKIIFTITARTTQVQAILDYLKPTDYL
jgi:hypothetical protein